MAILMIEEKDIYLKAINTFGAEHQQVKALEELGELSSAIARAIIGGEHNVEEEIADVEIMINQLKLIFDGDEIEHFKIIKLDRLKGGVW